MSDQIISSEWLVELSDGQLEMLAGGDSTQSSNNFAQRVANTNGTTTTGPQGNVTETNNQISEIVSGGHNLLSTDATGMSPFGSPFNSFNNIPSVNNVGAMSIQPNNSSPF
ncbi:MAG: CTB family bacteriocin [Gloeotrichia echinulata IR180]|jgi:hypothetical protein|nr:CTB family bacteriocin [Gloeotrichia echinulata DEX184]